MISSNHVAEFSDPLDKGSHLILLSYYEGSELKRFDIPPEFIHHYDHSTHRKIKELLRELGESFGHLAPSPINRAIMTNMNV